MPAAVPILLAVTAATAVYQGVEANQQAQHAKGAAEAEQTAMNAQVADIKKTTDLKAGAADKARSDTAGAAQAQAIAAIRAAMSTSGAMGGTILTGPQGSAPAPTQQKTLLGI